ncbi:hypothetical protein BTR23_08220 [Alkalihalophilus pseudofirmus]|uniref:hypothetical protein n=1 Tax=Alkalihalobacterium alkalinitrilicum TaxID=427920 RepID=UPI00094BF019|nr:hypothetical protein [Alkalihalobacterium alkalinitrilicum]OLO40458.1 hypothetical protein BTR23_08220 [Alkalihalophilus pseudofirmus]
MSLEWFDRVCGELQDYMESICEEYDEMGHITVDRAAKHPRIECFVEMEDDEREFFCTLFFDPHNEEFYIEEFDIDAEQTSRTLLPDIEDIIEAVHESFHDYLDEFEFVEEIDEAEEDDTVLLEEAGELIDDEDDYDEIVVDVEWTTPEVMAYTYMDEVEVSYQFGVIHDTGDGILRRVNRIKTEDNELLEDESNFIFSKEEAGTIIELIEDNMEALDGFDM